MGPDLSTLTGWTPFFVLLTTGGLGGLAYALAERLGPIAAPSAGDQAAAGTGTSGNGTDAPGEGAVPASTPSPVPLVSAGEALAIRVALGGIAALLLPVLPIEAPATVAELVGYGIIAGYGGPSLLGTAWQRFNGAVTEAKLSQAQQKLTETTQQLDTTRQAVHETLDTLDEARAAVVEAAAQAGAPGAEVTIEGGGLEGTMQPGQARLDATRAGLDAARARLDVARQRLRAGG